VLFQWAVKLEVVFSRSRKFFIKQNDYNCRMKNSFDIKYHEHFKLYILLKNKIEFESALINNKILFHLDDSELGVHNYSR